MDGEMGGRGYEIRPKLQALRTDGRRPRSVRLIGIAAVIRNIRLRIAGTSAHEWQIGGIEFEKSFSLEGQFLENVFLLFLHDPDPLMISLKDSIQIGG